MSLVFPGITITSSVSFVLLLSSGAMLVDYTSIKHDYFQIKNPKFGKKKNSSKISILYFEKKILEKSNILVITNDFSLFFPFF